MDKIYIEIFGDKIDYFRKICGIYEDYNFIEEDDEKNNNYILLKNSLKK